MPKKQKAYKCTKEVIETVCVLVEQSCDFKAIAKAIGVSERTLQRWRNKGDDLYQKKLVEDIEAVREKMSCGKTKADQHRQSQFHQLKKVVREPMLVDVRSTGRKLPGWARRIKSKRLLPAPVMPPTSFNKKEHIAYAREFLDLEIDKSYTVNEIRMECAKCVEALTVEVMIVVKEETSEAEPNQQAVKNVLTNCGPEGERWNFGQDHILRGDEEVPVVVVIGSNKKKKEDAEDTGN